MMPKHIKYAIKHCKHFILCAEHLDWSDDEISYNFKDGGLDILIKELKKLDDNYLKECSNEKQ